MLLTAPSSGAAVIPGQRCTSISILTGLAPSGVIEFVPKSNSTVQRMLALREDIFTDYDEAAFRTSLANNARILRDKVVSQHGRRLSWYDRH